MAYVEKRDKRSESELQRWPKTKSTTRAGSGTTYPNASPFIHAKVGMRIE